MQIRCTTCTKTIAIAPTGALPPSCPHCSKNPVPEQLGPYVPERLVATGGMGEVYLARHHELGTEVALKLLPAMPLDVVEDVRRRFAREARLTAEVTHPGVVRVLASDVAGDRPYLVLEFVDGVTVRQRLTDGPLPVTEAARIAADVADVLAAAHDQGVLHRDIKPDNIMIDGDKRVRVLDFGIARAMQDDAPLTRTGEIVGTPEYMAPEQLLDGPEATDARTDVHALGVLLYELLTGRSPFRGANLFQALKLVESLEPKAPSLLVAAVPPALDAVVEQALAKQKHERFASARAFAAAVRTAVPAAAPGPPQRLSPTAAPIRELGKLFVSSFLLSLASLSVIWWLVENGDAQPDGSDSPPAATAPPVPAGEREDLHAALAEGRWAHVLDVSSRAWDDGDDSARALARLAFLRSHTVWCRLAGLPPWLNACDLGQRQRLFGDLLEPVDSEHAQAIALIAGDEQAWRELGAQPESLGDAVRELLRIRELPVAEHSDALAAFAQRLPIDGPEHWLARTIERHLRGDRTGALQAAEMAWLSGAGEVAVLLEAGLAALTESGAAELRRSRQAAERIWQRLAAADLEDSPASILLQLAIECRTAVRADFDPSAARQLPAPHRANARSWFLAAAQSAKPAEAVKLLRVAAALGATPDFTKAPWQAVTDQTARTLLEQEANRD